MNIFGKKISAPAALIVLAVVFSFALALQVFAAGVTSVTVTPSSPYQDVTTSYTINWTESGAAGTSTREFVFPSGFDVSGAGPATTSITGVNGTASTTVSNQTVILTTVSGTGATSSASQSVTITGIKNPSNTGGFSITVNTKNPSGTTVASGTSVSFYIEKGFTQPPPDTTAPVSKIMNPVSGARLIAGQAYTIEGTGADNASVVTMVQVSVDGGATWQKAVVNSRNTSYDWYYVWTNPTAGDHTIKVRATDTENNVESEGPSVSVTVEEQAQTATQETSTQTTSPAETPAETPSAPMTVSELQKRISQLQQQLIALLNQLLQLLNQQLQAFGQ